MDGAVGRRPAKLPAARISAEPPAGAAGRFGTGQHTAALLTDVLDHVPCGIFLADLTGPRLGRLVQVNQAMSTITGYSEQQLLTRSVADLTHPDERAAHLDQFRNFMSGRGTYSPVERRWMRADGEVMWVACSATPLSSDRHQRLVGMIEDITARKTAENRLRELDLHDALTGLPNRALVLDRLEQALAESERTRQLVGVLYIDLDAFKQINDGAGHLVGDQMLIMVADRIRRHLRSGDTVGRIGGDEFVVVCTALGAGGTELQSIADRLLSALSEPYLHNGERLRFSASIGLSLSSPGIAAADLLRMADDAMYAAKDEGRNRVRRGTPHEEERTVQTARAARHIRIEAELAAALRSDELVLYGQPVLDLHTGAVTAVETLLRWNHATRGVLRPAAFLDVAETSDLMNPIGRRVLSESCRMAAGWISPPGHPAPVVFVNISGRQLEAGNLHDDVLTALQNSGLPASRLVLELTETFTPLIAGSLLKDLDDLRSRGVRIAIDDVGTGYSSLTRLTELPVDILKIDRSFVASIGQSSTCDAVVKAIISIGASLALQVVAEGVETEAQAQLLAEFGCETAQGYLYCTPRPELELRALVQQSDLREPSMQQATANG